MRNSSIFTKVKAVFVAASVTLVGVMSAMPMTVNATTVSSYTSSKAQQLASADFGGYLDRANDAAGMSKAQTAKEVFEFASQDADVAGDDWKFTVTVGDYYLDFMSGEVTTGGYSTGATVDVFAGDEPLFTAERDGDTISFGFENKLDLNEANATTVPFILTGQVSWGVETVCSADMAMAFALYDFIVEEDANQPEQTDPAPTEESVDALFDYFADSDIVNTFLNKRSEANNGVANGWKEFSDAKSLIPNSNGVTRWRSGVWELSAYGQKLTNTGLEQSFITVTDTETGNLLRFAFTEGGAITMAKKVGGVYTDTYNSVTVTPPSRYSVIEFTGNGEKIDTELLALVATVDSICANAPRG